MNSLLSPQPPPGPRPGTPAGRAPAAGHPGAVAEQVWQRHGPALHLMACAFLRDQSGAEVAVAQGISDFCARPEQVLTRDDEVARRELARIIYWRCSETSTRWVPSWSQPSLPPAMVWLREISMLQRTTLALCLFGAHSCRETAELLGLPPSRVGTLLRTGVLELTGAGWSPMDFVADVSTTSGDLVGAEAAPTMSTRQR